MKILLTGATGFVGTHVLNELSKYDHEIVVATIDEIRNLGRIKYIYYDLDKADPSANYFEHFEKPDLLIHLAWQGLPNYKSLFHFEKNLPSHYSFIKNLIVNGLKQAVITGTCFEYGMKNGCLSEDMDTDPQNPYALAKDTLRKFLFELKKHEDFELKWIRLFYMYGQGQNANSLLSQLDASLDRGDNVFNMSGGEQVRDYLPIERVAEYIVRISMQNRVTGIINCCSGKQITVSQLVNDHLEKKNKSIELNKGYYPYPDYEAMAFWGDDRKLKTILQDD